MLEEEGKKEKEMDALVGLGVIGVVGWATLGLVTAMVPAVRPTVWRNLREFFKA